MFRGISKALLIILAVSVLPGFFWSKGYESQKSVGGNTVTLKAEKYPLIKGDNAISIEVADKAKKPATDAKLKVRYFMPPMPGMAPMEYAVEPARKGDAYSFTANIPMEGVWKVEVTVTDAAGNESSATFNLDAR